MDIPWSDVVGVSTAALSAVAAGGAWKAALRANATADSVAAIERERWHADLTPEFEIAIKRMEGNRATLDVQLIGPLPLQHLHEVTVSIIGSDDSDRTSRLAGGVPQEEIDAQVWGPYKFTDGSDGADSSGRSVRPVPITVGQGRPFGIERTRPPHWQEGADRDARWLAEWQRKSVRLVLTCRRDGLAPWAVPVTVEQLSVDTEP